MVKFTLKNPLLPKSTLEFDAEIDDDGDFRVTANGIDLLYVSRHGALERFYVSEEDQKNLSALCFTDGQITATT